MHFWVFVGEEGERERERVRAVKERWRWGVVARGRRRDGKGERRENTLFRSIIFHWEATVFLNALGNIVDTQGLRSNIGILIWVHFCGFFEIFPKHREGNGF